MSDITDLLVGVDKLLSEHGFCEMASARHQLSIAISLHKHQLQQAHRQGWEQCQREALFVVQSYEHNPDRDGDFADQLDEAIASMEYKGVEK